LLSRTRGVLPINAVTSFAIFIILRFSCFSGVQDGVEATGDS
jgi:hypothetical protein